MYIICSPPLKMYIYIYVHRYALFYIYIYTRTQTHLIFVYSVYIHDIDYTCRYPAEAECGRIPNTQRFQWLSVRELLLRERILMISECPQGLQSVGFRVWGLGFRVQGLKVYLGVSAPFRAFAGTVNSKYT